MRPMRRLGLRTIGECLPCRPSAVALIVSVAVCSCGGSAQHAVGTVSEINPGSVCIARHDAMGNCYDDLGKSSYLPCTSASALMRRTWSRKDSCRHFG